MDKNIKEEKFILDNTNDEYKKIMREFLNPLLNDYYQFTMAYAYFVDNKHEDQASFDVFYRKNPFYSKVIIFNIVLCIKWFRRKFYVFKRISF